MLVRSPFSAGSAAALLLLVGACAPSDPQARVHKERARWNVQPLEWVQTREGAVQLSTRISGPPNSKIEALTVRIDLLDTSGQAIRQHWHSFDLTQIPRGGPKDVPIRLPAVEQQVDSVTVQRVLDPDPEQARHIKELLDAS
jgi:hypothetical protein